MERKFITAALICFSLAAKAELVPGDRIPELSPEDKWAASYAHQAVEQHKENQQLQCGFKEDRWHLDFFSHQAWAIRSGKKVARAENIVRQEALKKCKEVWAFVKKALKDADENIHWNCGFRGADWSRVDKNHFAWAIESERDAMKQKEEARQKALADCKG